MHEEAQKERESTLAFLRGEAETLRNKAAKYQLQDPNRIEVSRQAALLGRMANAIEKGKHR